MLISPRHLSTYFYVFLQGRAQPSESFSSSVINKGISRLAFPSAGCLGCQCYLSKQPTYPGIKPQISTVPPILYKQFELGKMPALKNAPTLVTMEIRRKEKKQGNRQGFLFFTEALLNVTDDNCYIHPRHFLDIYTYQRKQGKS